MRKMKRLSVHVGFCTILTLFISICLMIFASLSILTARSDLRLSTKYAGRIVLDYSSDAAAKSFTRSIEDSVTTCYQNSSKATDYLEMCCNALNELKIPNGITNYSVTPDNASIVVTFATIGMTNQQLQVQLTLSYPATPDDAFITITSWQMVHVSNIDSNQTKLHLFDDLTMDTEHP